MTTPLSVNSPHPSFNFFTAINIKSHIPKPARRHCERSAAPSRNPIKTSIPKRYLHDSSTHLPIYSIAAIPPFKIWNLEFLWPLALNLWPSFNLEPLPLNLPLTFNLQPSFGLEPSTFYLSLLAASSKAPNISSILYNASKVITGSGSPPG